MDDDSAAAFLGFSLVAAFVGLAFEAVFSAGACGTGAEASGSEVAGAEFDDSAATPSTAVISI